MDMSARKYSKTQGGFTSVDALWGMTVGTSPYIYSHHDPINFADPSGYGEITHGGGGSGGVTSGGSSGRTPYWVRNLFMLDAYSSDEARSINAESRLHRDVKKALWPDQQPKSTGKKSQQRPTATSKPTTPGQGRSVVTDFLINPIGTIWNSPPARYLIPDVYNVGIGFSGIYFFGFATSFEANWILRGKEASPIPIITATEALGRGGVTLNLGGFTYLGPVSGITSDMLETNLNNGPTNATVWYNGALTAGGKVNVGGSITSLSDGHYLLGGTVGIGAGLPLGVAPINAATGGSNTYILWRR